MKDLDWKVVVAVVAGCYVVPLILLGFAGGAFTQSDAEPMKSPPAVVLGALWAIYFLALPLLAGYFTAKHASRRPELHVLAVALAGVVLIFLVSRGAPLLRLGFGAASLAMAALGAFVALRRKKRPD